MTIKYRFALLLGAFLLAFFFAATLLRRAEQSRVAAAQESIRRERAHTLERWLELSGATLRQFANDYSLWDELVQFVRTPDEDWARINLIASLETFDTAAYWVLDPDGEVIHHSRRPADDRPLDPPVKPAAWRELTQRDPFPWFFHASHAALYEVRAAPIQPSDDIARTQEPVGWLVVARRWDDQRLADLGRLTGVDVSLTLPSALLPAVLQPDRVRVARPLLDWRDRPVRILHLVDPVSDRADPGRAGARAMRIFTAFGLLVIVVLVVTLQAWVVRPLNALQRSLAQNSPEPLGPLRQEPNEFGQLAQLVTQSFEQRGVLEKEIEQRRRVEHALRESEASLRDAIDERVRLGRDLHDSVIQAIYASGLGLAAVRNLLRTNPDEAERRLEHVRMTLNDTIRDLRNFITGLEPEALRRMSLSEAVHALVDVLRAAAPIEVAVDINEAAAEQLTPNRRANLLHIIREAVSNVLRHGRATLVHVAVLADDACATLVIADNGQGFDANAPRQSGSGLTNMIERAEDADAVLRVESALGKGTRVIVSFPLSTQP